VSLLNNYSNITSMPVAMGGVCEMRSKMAPTAQYSGRIDDAAWAGPRPGIRRYFAKAVISQCIAGV